MWFTHCKSTVNHYSWPPKISVIHTLQVNHQTSEAWFTHYQSTINHYSGPHQTKRVIHTLQVTCQPLQHTPYNKACDSHITSRLSTITADPIQQSMWFTLYKSPANHYSRPQKSSMWFTHYKSPVNHYSRPQTKKHVIHTSQPSTITADPKQRSMSFKQVITADPKQRSMIHTLQVNSQQSQLVCKMILMSSQPHRVTSGQSISL